MTGHIKLLALTPCQAMASNVETPAQGLLAAKARPLTVDMPIRIPVKEPGPQATAKASTSEMETPASERSVFAIGSRVVL